MDDTVHGATCAFNRFLKCIHGAADVLLKWVRYENVIVFGVAVIGTSAGEVIDPIVCMVAAARPIPSRAGCRFAPRRGLLSEKHRCSGYGSHYGCESVEVPAPSVGLHRFLLEHVGCYLLHRFSEVTAEVYPG